jgi:hypothetical protein
MGVPEKSLTQSSTDKSKPAAASASTSPCFSSASLSTSTPSQSHTTRDLQFTREEPISSKLCLIFAVRVAMCRRPKPAGSSAANSLSASRSKAHSCKSIEEWNRSSGSTRGSVARRGRIEELEEQCKGQSGKSSIPSDVISVEQEPGNRNTSGETGNRKYLKRKNTEV